MNQLNKVPPQALDLEKIVLGALMLERSTIRTALDFLKPETFYHQYHQLIYAAVLDLNHRSEPIHIYTVIEQLKRNKTLASAGGPEYVTALTNEVVSGAGFGSHCRILVEKYIRRECIRIAGEMYNKAFDDNGDTFETIETAQKGIHTLNQSLNRKGAKQIDTIAVEVFQELEALRHREHYLTGVASGHPTLDRLTCGWQKTDLILLGARPAVGKTAFALGLARNAAMNVEQPTPTAFFSLEMGERQLAKRILAAEAQMFLSSLRDARLTDGQMEHLYKNGLQKIAGVPLWVDDTASLNINQLKAKARYLVEVQGVGLIVIDYLQLIKSTISKNASRQQQLGEVSRELKIMAKELDVPVIALAQLNRDTEKTGKQPKSSDLRESGDLEQDADVIALLNGPTKEDILADAEKAKERTLFVDKHRNGETQVLINFEFDGTTQKFVDKGRANQMAVVAQLPTGNWKQLPTGTEDDNEPLF
jgi:replicative DNA helicase